MLAARASYWSMLARCLLDVCSMSARCLPCYMLYVCFIFAQNLLDVCLMSAQCLQICAAARSCKRGISERVTSCKKWRIKWRQNQNWFRAQKLLLGDAMETRVLPVLQLAMVPTQRRLLQVRYHVSCEALHLNVSKSALRSAHAEPGTIRSAHPNTAHRQNTEVTAYSLDLHFCHQKNLLLAF